VSEPVVVRPVRTAADLRAFIGLPYRLHRHEPAWVAPLRWEVRKQLSRAKNPFFQHAETEYLLASRREVVQGRIAAIHNRAHNAFHDDRVGFFGFFDCVNDPAVAGALFDRAAAWLRIHGLDTMRGPASPSTNDQCGLLVAGFDSPPTLLSPHNPPYYVNLIEQAQFSKSRDLYQYRISDAEMPRRLERADPVTERQGITLRSLDLKRFGDDLARIKLIYNRAWAGNWGFVPMTDAEIDYLAARLKPLVVPDLVVFAERRGETIGFAVALPDLNSVLRTNPSGRLIPGAVKLLKAGRSVSRIRIVLLGLLEEHRLTGADALMYQWIWRRGQALGYCWAEAGWVLEDNAMMINALVRLGFQNYKTLRLYDRPL
jgi:hypothetical protein